jgi:glycosyltransferase involved in cell wall biosynthesis
VPEIYRLVAASRGVFINPALTEPFGLTLLEAAASGLPIVATENGGPVDIIANCRNGRLVDPSTTTRSAPPCWACCATAKAWDSAARNGLEGVRKHYAGRPTRAATWPGSTTSPASRARCRGNFRRRARCATATGRSSPTSTRTCSAIRPRCAN